jgi:type II secretory pathway predicted ATPase ExeA
MYESTFQLQRRPFSATPDPSCVYFPQSVQTALDELIVCLERGEGIAILTAPAGLGKTLICEKVKQELGSVFVTLFLRHSQFASPADLLRTLLTELGGVVGRTANEQELRLELVSQLTELRRQNQLLVILCDEAHELREPLLDELRRLVDHGDHGTPWVRVLLCGQLELEEHLAEPRLAALNQRLRSHVTLSPLSAQEAWDYVDYRITWAGGRIEEVFSPEALTAIVDAADGVPRCLNQLCDHVLLLSYVADRRPAPVELVREALEDLQHLPLSWNIRPLRPSEGPSESEPRDDIGEAPSAVEFGDHLSSWDASSNEVWEFHPQNDDSPPEPTDQVVHSQNEHPVIDPVGSFLQAVEEEVTRIENERQAATAESGRVIEEPVLDRYAAIDAGWPTDDIPRDAPRWHTDEPLTPEPSDAKIVHRSDLGSDAPRMPLGAGRSTAVVESSVEERLSHDVLELVATTQESLAGRRVDEPPAADAFGIETPSAAVSPARPFRNLFTRLRRKQRGLE